jgi:ribosomal protein L19
VFDANITEDRLLQLKEPPMDTPAEFDRPLMFGTHTAKELSNDVWDPYHASKTIGYDYNIRLWYEQKEKERNKDAFVAESYNCSNVNESADGYCLVGQMESAKSSAKVQVGEIIGIQDTINSDGSMVEIGVVRRIKDGEKGLEIGIQKLSPCAEVVAVCKYGQVKREEKYTRALVLPAQSSAERPVTLLTHSNHKLHDQLIINKYGYCTHIKLVKLVECTGVYCQYEFAIIKIIGFEDDNPHEEKSPAEYDSMWTLI